MAAYEMDENGERMECPKCGKCYPIESFVPHDLGDNTFALYCERCHEANITDLK